jgi:hypothetical protein
LYYTGETVFRGRGQPCCPLTPLKEDWLKQVGFASVRSDICWTYLSLRFFGIKGDNKRVCLALSPRASRSRTRSSPSVLKVCGIPIPNGSSGFKLFRLIFVNILARLFDMERSVADRLKAIDLESIQRWLCQKEFLPGKKSRKKARVWVVLGGPPFPDPSAPALRAHWYRFLNFCFPLLGQSNLPL